MSGSRPTNATNPYAVVFPLLDIDQAIKSGLTRNDLLPPRPDDKAGGEVAERFRSFLSRQLQDGSYVAGSVVYVPVPKVNYATRLAALLTLSDRALYYALVEPLRGRIEKALIPASALLWPRAIAADKAWADLENAPIGVASSTDYVVLADVSSFYESVDHRLLGRRLLELTGNGPVVDALEHFLGELMGRPRGLPQGLDVSDVLATAYLSSADAGMIRGLWPYWRHGDDVRIVVPDHGAGRQALHAFESHLREMGLTLNGQKSRILKLETYTAHLATVDEERAALRNRIAAAREAALEHASDEEIGELADEAGVDEETQWGLFYHGTVTLDDVIEQLRTVLQPSDLEVAAAVFGEALRRAPDGDDQPLADEVFHVYLSTSLTRMAAGGDATAIQHAADLMARFPDKTELVSTYLRSLRAVDAPAVAGELEKAIGASYLFSWQHLWLLDSARLLARDVSPAELSTTISVAEQLQVDEEAGWLSRSAATRFLCLLGLADHQTTLRVYKASPRAVRADLVAGLCDMEAAGSDAWPTKFLESLKDDAMLQVVVNRNRSKS